MLELLVIAFAVALAAALIQVRALRQQLATQQSPASDVRTPPPTIAQVPPPVPPENPEVAALRQQLEENRQIAARLSDEIVAREREMAQSKALFTTIANSAYDPVFVLDESAEIISLNQSARDLFGENSNPLGEKIADALRSADLGNIIESVLENREDILEEQITLEGRIYKARTRFIHEENSPLFLGLALQDITQLVKLNRARRDMVANISHELRTPIANIRLIIDSLFHEKDKPKRKDSISSLRDIARETDTLLWLVQELLDLSMIESGQAIMKMIDMPLLELTQTTSARLEDQLMEKQLSITYDIPESLHILCDPDQTRRVLLNLIHNAMKWSPKGGAIRVGAHIDAEEVVIRVVDEGPGVPDDQCERIFERFYQVDASRSGGEGTGLGLAICKHIVEAHGGRIWAEGNSKGKGGRFLFTLYPAEQRENPVSPLAISR